MSATRSPRRTAQATLAPPSAHDAKAAIGYRVRTGTATAVLLGGPTTSPRVLTRLQVPLCDADDPDVRQPYHVVTEQDEARGMMLVRQTMKAATDLATRATEQLMKRAEQERRRVRAADLVVGSDVDPASLRSLHVRAHALEGRLYRDAVEAALSACGLTCNVFVEREVVAQAAALIGKDPSELKGTLNALGRAVGRPWGAQEKMATIAAWVGLVPE